MYVYTDSVVVVTKAEMFRGQYEYLSKQYLRRGLEHQGLTYANLVANGHRHSI